MAVTNLTGYTWVANNTLYYYLSQQVEYEWNINFTSNSNSYSLMLLRQMTIGDPSETQLYYDTTQVMNDGYWTNPAYKEIVISGGVDATNTEFIGWLEGNGTLTPPPTPSIADKLLAINQIKQDIKAAIENKGADLTGVEFDGYAGKIDEIQTGGGITNLTGYTWVGNNSVYAPGWGDYSINFTSNSTNYTSMTIINQGEHVIRYGGMGVYEDYWFNQNHKTVLFTGGTDVTNTYLIEWLEENGTLTAPSTGGYRVTVEIQGGMWLHGLKIEQSNGSDFTATYDSSCIFEDVTYIKSINTIYGAFNGITGAELLAGKTLTNDITIIVYD